MEGGRGGREGGREGREGREGGWGGREGGEGGREGGGGVTVIHTNSTSFLYTAGRLPTINMGRPFYRETQQEA